MKVHRTNMCLHFTRSNSHQALTVILSNTRIILLKQNNLLSILDIQTQCLFSIVQLNNESLGKAFL